MGTGQVAIQASSAEAKHWQAFIGLVLVVALVLGAIQFGPTVRHFPPLHHAPSRSRLTRSVPRVHRVARHRRTPEMLFHFPIRHVLSAALWVLSGGIGDPFYYYSVCSICSKESQAQEWHSHYQFPARIYDGQGNMQRFDERGGQIHPWLTWSDQ